MIFDQIPSLFRLWSELQSIPKLFRVPNEEECFSCDKMTRDPGTTFLRYKVKILG